MGDHKARNGEEMDRHIVCASLMSSLRRRVHDRGKEVPMPELSLRVLWLLQERGCAAVPRDALGNHLLLCVSRVPVRWTWFLMIGPKKEGWCFALGKSILS